MKKKVVELFKAGYEVVLGSYYGESVVESVEEIEETFEEAAEDEYLYLDVHVDDELHRVELFMEDES